MNQDPPGGEGGEGPGVEPACGHGSGVGLRRVLGPFDATMVVVGGIIGAGIFINPYLVAQRLPSPGWVLAAWMLGGVVAMAGAFAFAELGAVRPQAGGHYAYLREAYHPVVGFLYGWALLFMIETGAIAAVSLTFAEYTLRMAGRSQAAVLPLAVASILAVGGINALGVKPGSRVLNLFVVLKVMALAVLIGLGLWWGEGAVEGELEGGLDGGAVPGGSAEVGGERAGGGDLPLLALGAALVPIMFSYGGWQNANYVAEEIRDPRRNLPRSLIVGTAVVVLVYVSVNWVYLRTLGYQGLAGTMTPAADAARYLMGGWGDRFLAGAIAVSTFGFLNLAMLAPTRVYYAMARDGVFLGSVAALHPRFRSPVRAISLQTLWALLLVLTGTYAQLVDYVVFADWIFFGLAGASLFVFRRRIPVARRPARSFLTPGYPWLPALFVMVALAIVLSVVRTNLLRSGVGLILLATGVPAYIHWRARAGVGAQGKGAAP